MEQVLKRTWEINRSDPLDASGEAEFHWSQLQPGDEIQVTLSGTEYDGWWCGIRTSGQIVVVLKFAGTAERYVFPAAPCINAKVAELRLVKVEQA